MQKLVRAVGILLIIIGLMLSGSRYLNNYYIAQNEKAVSVTNVTAEQIKENTAHPSDSETEKNSKEKDAEFDFAAVRSVTSEDVQRAHENISKGLVNVKILGAVAMPDAGINISVLKGLGEEALLSGAGTFYPDQQMGSGNYPLASHNMLDGDQLLSPMINNTAMGDLIYLTDLDKVYIYETNFIQSVDPSRIDLVALDTPEPTITLMTCDDDLVHRFIVRGKLVEVVDFETADQAIVDLFI